MFHAPDCSFYVIQRLLTLFVLNSLVYLESKGLQVEGTIYGKTDSGYLVCVKVGSELCNGVIYHPKEQASSCNAIVLDNLQPHHYSGQRMRRKERDLNLPKPRWNDYNFFYAKKKTHSQISLSDKGTLGIHKDDCKILERSSS
ncbi:hypothetical protein RDI58_028277 [Solanum bulbocastanum]|uniref:Uncharacterized protein n=1 Tax=Solanum bulbocastanum TaxID=147425 RepID=A0AAN8SNP4_SOLBU